MDRDSVFQALADPNRRDMLDALLKKAGRSVSQLAEDVGISRQAADKHLQVLERAGLVISRRHGRERRHYLNPLPFNKVAIGWLRRFEKVRLRDLMPGDAQEQAE
ncbi:MAG: winged helix-turn-helix transcriptional regulator [Hyphomicrobiaceae bacterium]|nr:winged helix-turn-helix transcriptional regulator [Hyphomicrobiaceae bacterium]MCC0023191.1 winged helix-turn-helix transcriptional regulator [Hyphomicrobiaceae bacterium]